MSPCVGSLRGAAWDSISFFHQPNPQWFMPPEVVGTYFPGTATLGWGAWCGAGTLCSHDTPPKFVSTTHGWGTAHPMFAPLLPVWMDVGSLIPLLSDSANNWQIQLSFWRFWVMVLYLSCNFDVVVWRGEPRLSIPPSWLEVNFILLSFFILGIQ